MQRPTHLNTLLLSSSSSRSVSYHQRYIFFLTSVILILQLSLTSVASESSSILNMSSSTKEEESTNIKTIYLIRHAESEENRRLGSLKSAIFGLGKFKLPKKQDVVASMELLNVSAQIDSDVSGHGQTQIEQLGKRIAKDNFIENMGVKLVAHSPLKRARQTSHGMLQTVSPSKTTTDVSIDSSAKGAKHSSISRVIELEILTERTPMEWLPTHYDGYAKRIKEFENWLSKQEEDVIAIVGHSQYFRSMLGLKSKFRNVDVWSLKMDCSSIGSHNNTDDEKKDDVMVDLKQDDESEKDRKSAGIVNEIDGTPLEDLVLPRGWKQLRHHYRYDPNYTD